LLFAGGSPATISETGLNDATSSNKTVFSNRTFFIGYAHVVQEADEIHVMTFVRD
jgi:hypothetical protein